MAIRIVTMKKMAKARLESVGSWRRFAVRLVDKLGVETIIAGKDMVAGSIGVLNIHNSYNCVSRSMTIFMPIRYFISAIIG